MDQSGLETLGALEERALLDQDPEAPPASTWDKVAALPHHTVALLRGIGGVFKAGYADWRESDHKLRTATVSVGALALQASERLRVSTILVPTVAFDILQTTNNPVEAAVAGGIAFGGWCAMIGAVTTETIDHNPKAVAKFSENFPRIVRLAATIGRTLPGLDTSAAQDHDIPMHNRLGRRLKVGFKRGYTVAGIGNTAYVAAAAANGLNRAETHKLSLNASADSGVAVSPGFFGISEAIVQVAHSNPALAEQIQHDAANKKFWAGVAGLMIVGQLITNKLTSARNTKRQQAAEASELNTD